MAATVSWMVPGRRASNTASVRAATATAAPSRAKVARDRLTDAATRAGDDRDPALEAAVGHITVRYRLPSAIDGSAKKRIMLVCT